MIDLTIRSNRQFALNLTLGALGFMVAASEPTTLWEWAKFISGMALSVGMIVKAAWNETPGR